MKKETSVKTRKIKKEPIEKLADKIKLNDINRDFLYALVLLGYTSFINESKTKCEFYLTRTDNKNRFLFKNSESNTSSVIMQVILSRIDAEEGLGNIQQRLHVFNTMRKFFQQILLKRKELKFFIDNDRKWFLKKLEENMAEHMPVVYKKSKLVLDKLNAKFLNDNYENF